MSREAYSGFYKLGIKEEQLSIPDGDFWIGSDLKISHPLTLKPGSATTVKIDITPDNLPGDTRLLRQAHVSTRSIFMQLGVEVGHETTEILDWTLQGEGTNKMQAAIPLRNVGNRTVKIPTGMGVGSLFLWNGRTFSNGDIEKLVETSEVRMSGEEGVDWRYYKEADGVASGIQYRIDDRFRKFIAPSPDPIEMSDFSNRHDRDKIDRLLMDVPESGTAIDWITQTKSEIGLSKNINAIIEHNLNPNKKFFDELHRNSLLLKGGDDWRIRLELFSPTDEESVPHWVLLRFAAATSR